MMHEVPKRQEEIGTAENRKGGDRWPLSASV